MPESRKSKTNKNNGKENMEKDNNKNKPLKDADTNSNDSKDWINEIVPEDSKEVSKEEMGDIPIKSVPGIGPAIGEKLMAAGYLTLSSVAHASPMELVEFCEIGEHTAKRIITAARNQVGIKYKTAKQILHSRKNLIKISTGSKALDDLLGGGIESNGITELFGEFRTGKSQLCFQLATNTALDKKYGGLEAGVIYIDTEGTFRPERIIQMAQKYGENIDTDSILNRINVGRAYNSDHQMLLALESPKIIKNANVRLIIIDSLTSHFRAEYTGKGTLLERQQKLNKFLHQLLRLSDVYNIAVVVTNQVQANLDAPVYGNTVSPIGGNIVAHSCTTRIYLRKAKEDKRIARVIDSPSLPESEAIFRITQKGIEDVD